MQFSSIILALMAPMALAAPIIPRGVGTAFIHNACTFDVTVNPCTNGGDQGFTTIPAGTVWSQAQQNFGGQGQGVSLKVNKVNGPANDVAQFEYTINDVMSLVFYDLSLINGNPFGAWPQKLTSGGAGPSVSCGSNETPCAQAYTWADQVATQATGSGADLHYYICNVPADAI